MRTKKQQLGDFGEEIVVKRCACPHCKRKGTLKCLPNNFKCADVICDFCGYLAQVKAARVKNIEKLPKQLLGAAWAPQHARMKAGIYFSLFIVLIRQRLSAIYYLAADLQFPDMFLPRKPLSRTARKAGWRGFRYDLTTVSGQGVVRIA
ncbi:MAG TPA: DpnI domain-containing protein [Burkholderiales bacterium]|nr:DpnI domain-containing protein [Burkholderiales bacterium]